MELAHIIAFNLTLLAAIASPGPSLLYLMRTTLSAGRKTGVFTAFGLAVMAALWTLAALLGLDVLFTMFPWAYLLLKSLGAAYLIYLAWGMWRHAKMPLSAAAQPRHRRAFLSGMLVNLGNPKSVIFSAAVLLVIFPADLGNGAKAFIFANHLAVEMVIQPTLAILFSTPAIRQGYLRAKPLFDRIAAAALGALGLNLLFNR